MPPKRRGAAPAADNTPKGRRSKLAKENEISAEQEVEIREAWGVFSQSQPKEGGKEGVIPIGDVRRFFIALGTPVDSSQLAEFKELLDPDDAGYAEFSATFALAALKLNEHAENATDEQRNAELEHAYGLFTRGQEGPITISMLKRVAKDLNEDIGDEALRDMVLEANGGKGAGKGVDKEEFENVMRRAGVFK